MGILRHCSWFIIAIRRFSKSFISIHVVYICYHLSMLIVTLLVYKIIMYLMNIYCCRRQIPNWHRQIYKYNTGISIVIQDKTTFNWTKQTVKQLENLKCFEILPIPLAYNRHKKSSMTCKLQFRIKFSKSAY